MKINNLSEHNCIINRYLAEMRDCEYQKNRLLFRNNIKRIGEYEAFEISKTLNYENRDVTTPLGVAQVNFPTDKIVIGTIFRAGLPFHEGFLNIFDHSGNAFVSAYREYTNKEHTRWGFISSIWLLQTLPARRSSSPTRCLPPVSAWRWA